MILACSNTGEGERGFEPRCGIRDVGDVHCAQIVQVLACDGSRHGKEERRVTLAHLGTVQWGANV